MTWGEIQVESLQKMFLNKEVLSTNDLSTYRTDKKYKTYLAAMKQACNEALTQIYSVCEPSLKKTTITVPKDNNIIDLSEEISDYEKIYEIITPLNCVWREISKNMILVTGGENAEIVVIYVPKKEYVSDTTEDTATLPLDEEYLKIIPLYIAGELYKDDDLTVATVYMNEFSTMLNILIGKNSSTNFSAMYRMDI